MLYVQYVADVLPGKMEKYHQLVAKFLPLVEKYGAKTIGIWQTAVGNLEEVTVLECYQDMGNFEEVRAKMSREPLYQELLPEIESIRTASCKFLAPAFYSPLS